MVRSMRALVAFALLACSGCATSFARHGRASAKPDDEAQIAGGATVSTESATPDNSQRESAPTAAPAEPNRIALAGVLAELEAAGTLDTGTKERLVADLKQTDPALWPQLMQYFRASLAYKEEQRAEADAHDGESEAEQVTTAESQAGRKALPKHAATQRRDALATDQASSVIVASHKQSPAEVSADATPAKPETTAVATSEPPGAPASAASAKETQVAPAIPTAATPPAVTPAPADAIIEPERSWREHLAAAIAGLEKETEQPPDSLGAVGQHARLRMLYLVDGQRDAALKPIAGLPALQHDFWSREMYGLATYLDVARNPQETRRAAEAASALREATSRLGEMATLSVRNVAFCTEVSSYGVYKKFDHDEFHAGQEVLLYTEVENFKSQPSDKGFHTSLRSSYQILDERGARVDQKEFEVIEEHCQNARRDFFLRYFVWMPKRIYGGRYTLQLTIEDTLSQKIGQASIDFKIHEKDN